MGRRSPTRSLTRSPTPAGAHFPDHPPVPRADRAGKRGGGCGQHGPPAKQPVNGLVRYWRDRHRDGCPQRKVFIPLTEESTWPSTVPTSPWWSSPTAAGSSWTSDAGFPPIRPASYGRAGLISPSSATAALTVSFRRSPASSLPRGLHLPQARRDSGYRGLTGAETPGGLDPFRKGPDGQENTLCAVCRTSGRSQPIPEPVTRFAEKKGVPVFEIDEGTGAARVGQALASAPTSLSRCRRQPGLLSVRCWTHWGTRTRKTRGSHAGRHKGRGSSCNPDRLHGENRWTDADYPIRGLVGGISGRAERKRHGPCADRRRRRATGVLGEGPQRARYPLRVGNRRIRTARRRQPAPMDPDAWRDPGHLGKGHALSRPPDADRDLCAFIRERWNRQIVRY